MFVLSHECSWLKLYSQAVSFGGRPENLQKIVKLMRISAQILLHVWQWLLAEDYSDDMLFMVISSLKHILIIKKNLKEDISEYVTLYYRSFDHNLFSWNHISRCAASTLLTSGFGMEFQSRFLFIKFSSNCNCKYWIP